jgi:hypothetical protein
VCTNRIEQGRSSMSERIDMIAWCERDDCGDIVYREFKKISGNTIDGRSRLEHVSSLEEIESYIESGEIILELFMTPVFIVDSYVDRSDIVNILNRIASLINVSGEDKKQYIKCITWKDLEMTGAVSEAGFTSV